MLFVVIEESSLLVVEVLTDLSVLRSLLDRTPALDRLAQHGILATTVRQTVMEWSLAAPNEDLARQLRPTVMYVRFH